MLYCSEETHKPSSENVLNETIVLLIGKQNTAMINSSVVGLDGSTPVVQNATSTPRPVRRAGLLVPPYAGRLGARVAFEPGRGRVFDGDVKQVVLDVGRRAALEADGAGRPRDAQHGVLRRHRHDQRLTDALRRSGTCNDVTQAYSRNYRSVYTNIYICYFSIYTGYIQCDLQ